MDDFDLLTPILSATHDDAKALGCLCDECPLGPGSDDPRAPVLPEIRPGSKLYVIGEAPGDDEEAQGIPFVGRSGQYLMAVLRGLGIYRGDISISNALLCRPPSEMRAYLKHLGAKNKARKKAGQAPRPSPVQCCRPRVEREVREARAILTLGATAYASVTNGAVEESGLMRMRGYPQVWRAA